jgi:hypothetical protein
MIDDSDLERAWNFAHDTQAALLSAVKASMRIVCSVSMFRADIRLS